MRSWLHEDAGQGLVAIALVIAAIAFVTLGVMVFRAGG